MAPAKLLQDLVSELNLVHLGREHLVESVLRVLRGLLLLHVGSYREIRGLLREAELAVHGGLQTGVLHQVRVDRQRGFLVDW